MSSVDTEIQALLFNLYPCIYCADDYEEHVGPQNKCLFAATCYTPMSKEQYNQWCLDEEEKELRR